jgi:SAM-dependent methyltransferase
MHNYGQSQSNDLEFVDMCDLCGGSNFTKELQVGGWNLVKCRNCGLTFTSPRYTKMYSSKMYESMYYETAPSYLSAQLLEPSEDDYYLAKSLMKKCSGNRKNGIPRFLDVGCGGGFIVNAFQKGGWQAVGIDLSLKAVTNGRNRGLDLRAMDVQNIELGKFDLVAAFHVLEHVHSPREFLQRCTQRMHQNGYMLIEVPDYGCRAVGKMRENWPYFHPDRHLFQFTCETLTKYLTQAKFDLVRIERVHGRGLVEGYSSLPTQKGKNRDIFRNLLLKWRRLFYWCPKNRRLLRHLFCHTLGYGEFIRALARRSF